MYKLIYQAQTKTLYSIEYHKTGMSEIQKFYTIYLLFAPLPAHSGPIAQYHS